MSGLDRKMVFSAAPSNFKAMKEEISTKLRNMKIDPSKVTFVQNGNRIEAKIDKVIDVAHINMMSNTISQGLTAHDPNAKLLTNKTTYSINKPQINTVQTSAGISSVVKPVAPNVEIEKPQAPSVVKPSVQESIIDQSTHKASPIERMSQSMAEETERVDWQASANDLRAHNELGVATVRGATMATSTEGTAQVNRANDVERQDLTGEAMLRDIMNRVESGQMPSENPADNSGGTSSAV